MIKDYEAILQDLKLNSHHRAIRNIENKTGKFITINGNKLLNLSSNNYLGLADNSEVVCEFLKSGGSEYSFGSASARLLTGTLPIYKELETTLANLFNKESALIFNSGYHANVGINSSIVGSGDVIFSDKLNHASIIDGMSLGKAKFFRYQHNSVESLEKLLQRERDNFKNAVIVTESIFSMDGDCAPLEKLVELKEKYNCILIVDEAHAFGVFGEKGLGVCEHLNILDKVDLIVGTFGKAIGSVGAFVVGNSVLIDYLTNKARAFIFSTALPPINIAFTVWILKNYISQMKQERYKMLNLGQKLNKLLNSTDYHFSHIIPFVIGENQKTCEICDILYQNGYFTLPIRPPTVPQGTSRLRLSLTTDIDEHDLNKLVEILKNATHLDKQKEQ